MRKADAMTGLGATIISLTLIGGAVVFPSRAQTDAAQPASAPAQQGVPQSNTTQSRPPKRQHAAHPSSPGQQGSQPKPSQSGVKPQGNEMKGMPGTEGMQDQPSTPV